MFLLGWGGDYPDMTDWVDYHFGTGANAAFGKKFSDITSVLTKAASELDPTARLGEYKDANNLIRQHVPMIPLSHAAPGLKSRHGSGHLQRGKIPGPRTLG